MIRRATPADAEALAALAARTFEETFGAANRPQDMAEHLAEAYGVGHQGRELADPDWLTLLVEHDAALIGYAQLRRHPPPDCVRGEAPVELHRFYVDRPWHGKGIAQRLMSAAHLAARELGGRTLWLGVWEHNPRAIAFYLKSGFQDLGSTTFYVGTDRQTDRVLAVPVAKHGPPQMTGDSPDNREVVEFYTRGLERDRLSGGSGALELARTRTLLQRFLPAPPAVIADIGGGPGRYAIWLAGLGYAVHLVDPVPLHVEQARLAFRDAGMPLASAEPGDARALQLATASVDAVLLLGPLYHLPERADRIQAWAEARRICRPGGVVLAAAISRFASTLDGLRGGYLADPAFARVAEADRADGRHRNPTGDPAYFTTAYFHRPEELAGECTEAGLYHESTLAIEGPAWLLADLDDRLADETRRQVMLDALQALEAEPAVLGVSAHLLVTARRP